MICVFSPVGEAVSHNALGQADVKSVLIFSHFSFVTFIKINVCNDSTHKLGTSLKSNCCHLEHDLFCVRTSRHAAPCHLPDHQSVAVDVGHDVGLEVVLVQALV